MIWVVGPISEKRAASISSITVSEIPAETVIPEPVADLTDAASVVALGGTLPTLVVERPLDRWVWTAVAAVLVATFAWAIHVYWVPAHAGVDQNGYLVGGKLFARTGSNGFVPENPYAFVGRMWVEFPGGKMFPKYPLGLSAIFATALKLGGAKAGTLLPFLVSPVAMTLALVATFLFVQTVAGSFAAVLGVMIVGTSPVTIGLADNPNSHATALCLVTWGMHLAMRWWQRNGLWRAIVAGLLIGSAVTIRYTEGLVALPMGLIALLNLRWRDRRSWVQSGSMLAAWALPVASLAVYNWVSFHHLTGYDPTNESTGFTWESFKVNWETMLRELYNTGLFFVLPFSVMGLILTWRWNARVALVITAWVVPNLALYTAYYWAPDNASIGYLRFFLTIFPALALSAVWSIKWFLDLAAAQGARWTPAIAIGAVMAVACGMNVYTAAGIVEPEARGNAALRGGAQEVLAVCPAGSTLFSTDQLLNYLQFVGDYHLYDTQQFNRQAVQRFANIDPNQPSPLQAQRAKELYDRLHDASDYELVAEQNRLMIEAMAAKRRVFLIFPANQLTQVNRFLPRRSFSSTKVGSWTVSADPQSQRRQRGPGANGVGFGGPGGGFGGPGGGFGGRAGGGGGGFGARRAEAGDTTWDIFEVKTVLSTSSSRHP